QLLQHGLLRGSFVPARELRQLRDLTRGRAQLVGERTRTANRIHKVLEDANIKLGAVATDVLGVSGRRMIQAMVAGETDANVLSELAQKQLRAKIPERIETTMAEADRAHAGETDIIPFAEAVNLVMSIPGIDRRTAQNEIAEIGTDMGQFPDRGHRRPGRASVRATTRVRVDESPGPRLKATGGFVEPSPRRRQGQPAPRTAT
ncbi:MAG: hypothetical protein DMF82_12700, partial [Acidobacteria bacterium]